MFRNRLFVVAVTMLALALSPARAHAQYNASPTLDPPDNLVRNGRFAQAPEARGPVAYGYDVRSGSDELKGWTAKGAVTVFRNDNGGGHTVRLAGGSVSQTLYTVPGKPYELTVDVSAWPGGQPVKSIEVQAGSRTQTFAKPSAEAGAPDFWTTCSLHFRATTDQTKIRIRGVGDGSTLHGPRIGAVVVLLMDEPSMARRSVVKAYQGLAQGLTLRNVRLVQEMLATDFQGKLLDGRTLTRDDVPAELKKTADLGGLYVGHAVQSASYARKTVSVDTIETRTWMVTQSGRRTEHRMTSTHADTWVEASPGRWVMKTSQQKKTEHTVDGKPFTEEKR